MIVIVTLQRSIQMMFKNQNKGVSGATIKHCAKIDNEYASRMIMMQNNDNNNNVDEHDQNEYHRAC